MSVWTHWQKISLGFVGAFPNPGWFIPSIFCQSGICAFCTPSDFIKSISSLSLEENLPVKGLVINHVVASVSFISLNKLHMTPCGFQPVANTDSWSVTEGYFIWENTKQWCSCFPDYSGNFWDLSIILTNVVFNVWNHYIIRKLGNFCHI